MLGVASVSYKKIVFCMPYVKSFINQSCLVSIAEFQPHSYPIFVHLDIMLGQQLDAVVDTGRAYSLHVLYHERNCNHLFFFFFFAVFRS